MITPATRRAAGDQEVKRVLLALRRNGRAADGRCYDEERAQQAQAHGDEQEHAAVAHDEGWQGGPAA
jgi:hypothetical protein